MENFSEEIEYFGFLPISFTTDIQESLQEALADILQEQSSLPSKAHLNISESFKKNIFIFNNFVLRNILKFPANFRLERKITDKHIIADINKLAEDVNAKEEEHVRIDEEIRKLHLELSVQKMRNKYYKELKFKSEKTEDRCLGAREIKKFLKDTGDLYEKFKVTTTIKNPEFDRLMEYKNIKNDFYRDERNRLFNIAQIDALERINGSL